ncbi:MAG: hypothetical protein BGO39_15480 [Chloroflexi bacterium 54-19]|nr:MAG: hypothetical protein BGO39_15480 [Chloroflexi bacterium 54-19]
MLQPTTSEKTTQVLKDVITRFESDFKGRVQSYYLEGSYADNSQVGSSDLDLLIVFKGDFETATEEQIAIQLGKVCAALSPVELDLTIQAEASLAVDGLTPGLMWASKLIYGTAIRDKFNLVSIEQWTRDRMHTSYWRTAHLFNRKLPLTIPLDFPDVDGVFFGYDLRKLRLADGSEVNCTRDLIRLVGWSATALIAYLTGQYVPGKREVGTLYREYINDEWTDLIEEIYYKCRGKWNYLIPTNPAEREELRNLCRQTLAFENHFIEIYLKFLQDELTGSDVKGCEWAKQILTEIPYLRL